MKDGNSNKYILQHIHKDKMWNSDIKFDNVICDSFTHSQPVKKLNEIERIEAMQKIHIDVFWILKYLPGRPRRWNILFYGISSPFFIILDVQKQTDRQTDTHT